MRIAFVHSVYADEGLSGENVTVDQQAALLADAGHELLVEQRSTTVERHRPLYPARMAWQVATGRGGDVSKRLRDFAPDILHVHNLFPNFGTDWLASWAGPVVATLHNYRYGCANGLLLREGRPCLDCLTGSSRSAVEHACYRGSKVATAPLAIASRHGFAGSPVVMRADRIVAVAEHARDLFVRFGVPADRIDVVPHGIAPRHAGAVPGPAQPRFLVAGRLSPEKGVDRLLREWPEDLPLDVVGDGPQADLIATLAGPNVRLLGARDAAWRDDAASYTALIAPGIAVEAAVPRVVVEAWEAGVPVVAFSGGGGGSGVRACGGGVTYDDAVSLRAALDLVAAAGAGLRADARAAYERHYTPAAWLTAIERVYARAAEHDIEPAD